MDGLTVFSKKRGDHTTNLCKVFQRCREFGISLNPKKCIFGVTEGKLLGHIISEKGIAINLERVEAILKIQLPTSKNEIKSFFGKINFVMKFIIGFVEIIKPLNAMLKWEAKVEWNVEAKEAFEESKRAIVEAPVLVSLDYAKTFYIYLFTSDHSYVGMLTQKSNQGNENPIEFMSTPLKDAELRYPSVEKQAYTLVRAMNKFRHYILKNKVFAIVPNPAVKLLLIKNELGERRAKWVTMLQEYDIEIQPIKLVRGQGLTRTMAEMDPNLVAQHYNLEDVFRGDWYDDIIYYLFNQRCLDHLSVVQRRELHLKSDNFMLKGVILYKKNHEGVYLRCLGKHEAERVMEEFHDRYGTHHGFAPSTENQILRVVYYWPTLFKDAHNHVKTFHVCQTIAARQKYATLPL